MTQPLMASSNQQQANLLKNCKVMPKEWRVLEVTAQQEVESRMFNFWNSLTLRALPSIQIDMI
jgi:hypothetical protein